MAGAPKPPIVSRRRTVRSRKTACCRMSKRTRKRCLSLYFRSTASSAAALRQSMRSPNLNLSAHKLSSEAMRSSASCVASIFRGLLLANTQRTVRLRAQSGRASTQDTSRLSRLSSINLNRTWRHRASRARTGSRSLKLPRCRVGSINRLPRSVLLTHNDCRLCHQSSTIRLRAAWTWKRYCRRASTAGQRLVQALA